jgi:hypothetical protein
MSDSLLNSESTGELIVMGPNETPGTHTQGVRGGPKKPFQSTQKEEPPEAKKKK